MDTSNHYSLSTLFEQLGLASSPSQIEQFTKNHKLADNEPIEKASFWSSSQASFLEEAILEDSDWTEVVDNLSVKLRQ